MPSYDYECRDCKEHFSTILTLSEYNRGDAKCPKCGSANVQQQPSTFFAVTSKKS